MKLSLYASLIILTAAASQAAEAPRLFPDYTGVTLPPNIAPLNFRIQEPGTAYKVEMRSTTGPSLRISSATATIRIPPKAWTSLLHSNPGQPLIWEIAVRSPSSRWIQLAPVTNYIAREEVDGWLAYRLLKPIFNYYLHLGIYERDLASFEERLILANDKFDHACLNCHTPLNRSPETFAFNIRGEGGKSPMILVISNEVARVDKTMGYLAWHPSGRLVVFSSNRFFFFFHTLGEARDIYDEKSDLGVYQVGGDITLPPAIAASDRNETWPAWSPDGRYLYFSSAEPLPREKFRRIRYDLMRVPFDLQTGRWGEPEMVISSVETGLSACQPKISPDGRFLLATLSANGNFPIYQSSSDLYLMDLQTRQLRRLEICSPEADTWHSWSGNSRWVVFSSKRLDGLFARPYFSYVDERGAFHKPFVLPQEDPSFYGFCLNTFNVPEFMTGPVTVPARALAGGIVRPLKILQPRNPTQAVSSGSSAGPDSSQRRRE